MTIKDMKDVFVQRNKVLKVKGMVNRAFGNKRSAFGFVYED